MARSIHTEIAPVKSGYARQIQALGNCHYATVDDVEFSVSVGIYDVEYSVQIAPHDWLKRSA